MYAGITNNLVRRTIEHGSRFLVKPLTKTPLIRGKVRAIEQALIVRAGGPGGQYLNKINSISPKHPYYNDAVRWGEAWLRKKGL